MVRKLSSLYIGVFFANFFFLLLRICVIVIRITTYWIWSFSQWPSWHMFFIDFEQFIFNICDFGVLVHPRIFIYTHFTLFHSNNSYSIFIYFFSLTGFVDTQKGSSHIDGRRTHLHIRRTISGKNTIQHIHSTIHYVHT